MFIDLVIGVILAAMFVAVLIMIGHIEEMEELDKSQKAYIKKLIQDEANALRYYGILLDEQLNELNSVYYSPEHDAIFTRNELIKIGEL